MVEELAQVFTFESAGKQMEVFTEQMSQLKTDGDAAFRARIVAEQKRLYPKKKKNIPDLPKEFIDALIAELSPIYVRYYSILWKCREALEIFRRVYAATVPMVPNDKLWTPVKEASMSSYSSQGWGASKYAKDSLVPYAGTFKRLGFRVDTKFVSTPIEHSKYTHDRWQLTANCTPLQAEAGVMIADSMSYQEMAKIYLEAGLSTTNLRVLYPFMPEGYGTMPSEVASAA